MNDQLSYQQGMVGGPVRRRPGVIALFAVAVLLAAVAVWFRVEASDRSSAAAGASGEAGRLTAEVDEMVDRADSANAALTDPAATAEVIEYVTSAIEATFSYDYGNLAATTDAVDRHLTGEARCVYDSLFGAVIAQASAQQLVLSTTLHDIALVRLEGDRAEALVFIDQRSTRADGEPVLAGAQVSIGAERQDDQWKITQFDLFGQPLVDGKPVPEC